MGLLGERLARNDGQALGGGEGTKKRPRSGNSEDGHEACELQAECDIY